ncbi:APC family permease [Acidianus sulfidivorans JP7]|uniref:APC family permease n=1 Tax=Acidianus sulfidivorans JP7 TaxID=619593 RepID=A0A2U9ILD5_9CREN|nr:APC family permease [Acidianus sulfidivorans]AWR96859.1 APC family permease [Acidianus sulfidivorans JP7]
MASEKSKSDEKSKLFARESSGLVREISWFAAISISMGFLSFYLLPVSFLYGLYITPNVIPILAVLLSWIILLPHSFLWTKISSTFQRTGADYVFASRALHPAIGVGTGLAFGISQMIFDAAVVYDGVGQLQTGFAALGVKYGGAFSSIASFLSSPVDILVIGAITFTLVIMVNIFGAKYVNNVMSAVTIIALATFVISGILMSSVKPSSIALSGYTYSQLVSDASKATPLTYSNILLATIALSIFISSPYVNGPTSVAGEVKGGKKSFMASIFIGFIISSLMVTFFILSSLSSLGKNFFIGASIAGANNLINPIFDVILSVNNLPLDVFLAIGSFFWYIAIMFSVALFVSRYFMAVSFDKVLPTIISYTSERFHSPVVAHLIDEIITIMALVIITVTPLSSYYFYGIDTGSAMATIFGFPIVIIASIVSVFRNDIKKLEGNQKVILSLGLIDLAVFILFIFYTIAFSNVYLGISINPVSLTLMSSPFIAGIVIYYIMRQYRLKKEGIDINMTFREIPPE